MPDIFVEKLKKIKNKISLKNDIFVETHMLSRKLKIYKMTWKAPHPPRISWSSLSIAVNTEWQDTQSQAKSWERASADASMLLRVEKWDFSVKKWDFREKKWDFRAEKNCDFVCACWKMSFLRGSANYVWCTTSVLGKGATGAVFQVAIYNFF